MLAAGRSERRRVRRAEFDAPVPVIISGINGHLIDLSAVGARIEHDAALAVRRELKLRFEYSGSSYLVSCEVVRCRLERSQVKPGGIAYSSGLRFTVPDDASRAALRDLVAGRLGQREGNDDPLAAATAAV